MCFNLSRPLDVHKWSNHPEVNNFVNFIYEHYFEWHNPKIIKKHIKVILLDLYVAWKENPLMKLGVHMNNNAYKAKSRYNELHISKKAISVVNHLHSLEFIHLKSGYFGQGKKEGRVTRIWAADKLIKHFQNAKYTISNIENPSEREVVILRDKYKKDVEYEDTSQTNNMRVLLKEYNELIKTLFLTAINSKDEKSCFQAVKSELQMEIPYFKFSFKNLRLILNQIKDNHSEIADDFCNGKGIGLLNLDSQIAEYIIEKFVAHDIPILCVHDSFIVSVKQDNFLRKTMVDAVENKISNANPKIKRVGFGYTEIHSNRHLDRDFYLDRMIEISNKYPD